MCQGEQLLPGTHREMCRCCNFFPNQSLAHLGFLSMGFQCYGMFNTWFSCSFSPFWLNCKTLFSSPCRTVKIWSTSANTWQKSSQHLNNIWPASWQNLTKNSTTSIQNLVPKIWARQPCIKNLAVVINRFTSYYMCFYLLFTHYTLISNSVSL